MKDKAFLAVSILVVAFAALGYVAYVAKQKEQRGRMASEQQNQPKDRSNVNSTPIQEVAPESRIGAPTSPDADTADASKGIGTIAYFSDEPGFDDAMRASELMENQDLDGALPYLISASSKGSVFAKSWLGLLYMGKGTGGERCTEGEALLREACSTAKGAFACATLGSMYTNPFGADNRCRSENLVTAYHYYTEANERSPQFGEMLDTLKKQMSPQQLTELSSDAPTRPSAGGIELLFATRMGSKGYTPVGDIVRVPADSNGGVLALQKGTCQGSRGERCEKVFIAFNGRFLGADTLNPSWGIEAIQPTGTSTFTISYLGVGSIPPETVVVYKWDGSKIIAEGTPPTHAK